MKLSSVCELEKEKNMDLVKISKTTSQPHGIGNNWGETITEVYKCPCGESTITVEIETTTGHKSIFTSIDCPACAKDCHIINENSHNWSIESVSR
mgnify:FL=1